MGRPTQWEIKKEQRVSIYKWTQDRTVKLLAHQCMLNENFSRGLHKGIDKDITEGRV